MKFFSSNEPIRMAYATAYQNLTLLRSQLRTGRINAAFFDQRLQLVEKLLEETQEEALAQTTTQIISRNLQAVNDIINNSFELEDILKEILDFIIKYTEAERGFIVLIGEDKVFHVPVAHNFDSENLPEDQLIFSRTIARQVFETKEAIISTNAQEDPRYAGQVSIMVHGMRSILAIPLTIADRTIGAIYIDNCIRTGLFSDNNLEVIYPAIQKAAAAIEAALRHYETRQQLADLSSKVNRIHEQFGIFSSAFLLDVQKIPQDLLGSLKDLDVSGESAVGKIILLITQLPHYTQQLNILTNMFQELVNLLSSHPTLELKNIFEIPSPKKSPLQGDQTSTSHSEIQRPPDVSSEQPQGKVFSSSTTSTHPQPEDETHRTFMPPSRFPRSPQFQTEQSQVTPFPHTSRSPFARDHVESPPSKTQNEEISKNPKAKPLSQEAEFSNTQGPLFSQKSNLRPTQDVKFLITGPPRAGKTQFIKSVSEIELFSPEDLDGNGDREVAEKSDLSGQMDFGRITIDDDMVLYLLGTSGGRFDFMWEILAEGMAGFVVIVDSTRPETFREAKKILEAFRAYAPVPYVIAANKQDLSGAWRPEDLRIALRVENDHTKILPCSALDSKSVENILVELVYSILEEMDGPR